MQMIRSMIEHDLKGRIRNKDIKKGLVVANIEEKMKYNSLRWFGHVQWGNDRVLEIGKEDKKLEFGRLKKRTRKTEDDLGVALENNMKDQD